MQCLHTLDEAENVVNFRERLWLKLQLSYDHLNPTDHEMCLLASCVLDVDCLNHESSKKLFMTHAFLYLTKLSPSFSEWVDKILMKCEGLPLVLVVIVSYLKTKDYKIVAKCEGLPLTLEVICSYLKTRHNKSIWRQCFHTLDEAENVVNFKERLWSKLQVSYDHLNPTNHEMFLDTATFFNNFTWNLQAAKSCRRKLYRFEDIRWSTLVDLSLVYDVNEDDCIRMH
ncbi:hypothetical protein MPTK1_3g23540 [Marchantia polymorpha subsp. ruderalis]|uniref:NB-ARC domain-containing protein n=2 Tax=Marchantia polymorpha TaxID=3197 RepID=A0AAF6B409_MARPO|nr:hypothetical protein MARPO_0024s0130 [Marchantia polymorpha]BBN06743.1 hypothetical protein Mp_3g23540 [Marchantia polymorpha subsp. ruderalis]|eukprot:PTQ43642.1 hypothetical protein MARPO_0024s0130 [Marchantia polymorpha]